MRSVGKLASALGVMGFALLGAHPSHAQDAEANYYKGKTVRFTVGYAPGGGYDLYARMIAPGLAKRLNATVVVENQPGAGGIVALNGLSAAPPDGLRLMIVNGAGAALAQVAEQSAVRYDLSKMGQLGTISTPPWMWLASPKAKFNTPEEAEKAGQIMWAAGGPMDGLSDGAQFTCAALKMTCRVVMGYGGSNQAALAVSTGEMDAMYVSDTSANNYVQGNQVKPVAAMARKRSRYFPDVKTIFEAVSLDKDQQWLVDFRAEVEDLGRILVTVPNLPPARLAFLQKAVRETLTDPELIAEGERAQRFIDFEDAETTLKRINKTVSEITPEQRARVKEILAQTSK